MSPTFPPSASSVFRELRLLTPDDAGQIASLAARSPQRFLTPRLYLEVFGYQTPFLRTWGAFGSVVNGQGGDLHGLLFRYHNSLIAADLDGSCGAEFAHILDGETNIAGIRGSRETVQELRKVMRGYKVVEAEDSYFLQLTSPPDIAPELLRRARRATLRDLDKLTALYATAGIMYRSRANIAAKLRQVRVFVVEDRVSLAEPSRIVSCALLNVESREAGLIGGVFTQHEARSRGYAAACVAALSQDLQKDGKLPCLFYENPVAGRVYTRLGFEASDDWSVLYLNPISSRA